MNSVFAQGSTHVVLPAFTPEATLQTIEDERISAVLLVPTMIQMMVDHPDVAKRDLASLKAVLYGASPISEAVIERATRALPNAEFSQGYGMTELSAVATLLRPEYHRSEGRKSGKARSAGRATFCAEVRIVDANDQELPRGEIGEIAVLSATVMLGYWNQPEATRAALRGGWMHTGDAGYMDAEGFLFVVDRIKDMIVSGGENIYSAEVENVLQQHPAIASCAVIGVPDEKWGERVHAFVVLKPCAEASAAALQAHCQQHIAAYKCPRGVEFVKALPISGAGKVLKATLRAPYWEGRERQVG
jgi:long-chain acyl-CoA synthetase